MEPYCLIENHFTEHKSKFRDFKLFEAGFGDLGFTLDFFYKIPFSKYCGIEKFKKHELKISALDENGRGLHSNSNDDEYERYVNYFSDSIQTSKLTRGQFTDIFHIEYETLVENYIWKNKENAENYNLGIFSNIFHKIPNKSVPINILTWFQENSKDDAFLYFKVMKTEKYAYKNIDFIYSNRI